MPSPIGADSIDDIRRCAKALGKAPTVDEFNEFADYTHHVATYRYGSWNEALRQAGFEPNRRSPTR